jgi:3-methyl-2-oxobutanoate hydroxymethyltransferase
MSKKITVGTFLEAKKNKEKITMLTAYDYSMAQIVDKSGVEAILVGDSLGMVVQGYDSTLEVTIEDMIYHCRAVRRGAQRAIVIGDMPFLSYHISTEEAVRNAGRLVKEGRAEAVKLEGGLERIDVIKAIIRAQIPVVGHIGLTPQSVNVFGGFKVQGRGETEAKKIIDDALALDQAGVFAIVLEGVPKELAKIITEKVQVPTIGIGAGKDCDGQVLVVNDMLGMFSDFTPKFVKKYANLNEIMVEAIKNYVKEVKTASFPEVKHTFKMSDDVLEKLKS